MSRCPERCSPPHAPDGWSREAQRQHPTYRHYVDAAGVQCELERGHPDADPRLHRNGLLTWWNPKLLVLGGVVVDDVLEEAAAVGKTAVSGSAVSIGEPERAAVSSSPESKSELEEASEPHGAGSGASSSSQLTVLPGETFEDIFGDAA